MQWHYPVHLDDDGSIRTTWSGTHHACAERVNQEYAQRPWKRTLKKDAVVIAPSFFVPLNEAETDAFAAAAEHYSKFVGRDVHGIS